MPNDIEPTTLRELLRYEHGTGHLFWMLRPPHMFSDTPTRSRERNARWWNGRFSGKRACRAYAGHGYSRVCIFGESYLAHRVIWAMETGIWPKETIDHVDGDKSNNVMSNLREATSSENNRNRASFGASLYRGVGWRKRRQLWAAAIKHEGKSIFLGYFANENEAALAYDKAAIHLHKEFARLNFPQAHYTAQIMAAFGIDGEST